MYKKEVEGDLIHIEETRWKQCKKRFEDGGHKDWNDMAMSQETPAATRNWKRLIYPPSLECNPQEEKDFSILFLILFSVPETGAWYTC